jgi:hypothetical protein
MDKVALGQVFSEYFDFSLPILIALLSRADTKSQTVTNIPS